MQGEVLGQGVFQKLSRREEGMTDVEGEPITWRTLVRGGAGSSRVASDERCDTD